MPSLNWKAPSEETSASSSTADPWFSVTVGIIGFIAGYILAHLTH